MIYLLEQQAIYATLMCVTIKKSTMRWIQTQIHCCQSSLMPTRCALNEWRSSIVCLSHFPASVSFSFESLLYGFVLFVFSFPVTSSSLSLFFFVCHLHAMHSLACLVFHCFVELMRQDCAVLFGWHQHVNRWLVAQVSFIWFRIHSANPSFFHSFPPNHKSSRPSRANAICTSLSPFLFSTRFVRRFFVFHSVNLINPRLKSCFSYPTAYRIVTPPLQPMIHLSECHK